MWQGFKRIGLGVLHNWVRADGFGLSAALSFYAMFSLAPILVFALLLASHFLGGNVAREAAQHWLETFISADEAKALIEMVHVDTFSKQSWAMTMVAALMFLWAASLSFVRLRVSMNRLLDCQATDMREAVKYSLIGRGHALIFTLVAGVTMAAGIWFVTLLSSFGPLLAAKTGLVNWAIMRGAALALVVLMALIVYRLLPLKAPCWTGTWVGIGFLVVAFELGRLLLNLYLQHSWITAAYGAANTLVIFLVWIYYTAQILLLGATIAGVISAGDKDSE